MINRLAENQPLTFFNLRSGYNSTRTFYFDDRSEVCSSAGQLVCGECRCDAGHYGRTCQCSGETESLGLEACKQAGYYTVSQQGQDTILYHSRGRILLYHSRGRILLYHSRASRFSQIKDVHKLLLKGQIFSGLKQLMRGLKVFEIFYQFYKCKFNKLKTFS